MTSARETLSGALDPSHPLAPMAGLAPSMCHNIMVANYALVATVAVSRAQLLLNGTQVTECGVFQQIYTWEFMNNLVLDYKHLVHSSDQNFKLSGVVNCISRLLTYLPAGEVIDKHSLGYHS